MILDAQNPNTTTTVEKVIEVVKTVKAPEPVKEKIIKVVNETIGTQQPRTPEQTKVIKEITEVVKEAINPKSNTTLSEVIIKIVKTGLNDTKAQ